MTLLQSGAALLLLTLLFLLGPGDLRAERVPVTSYSTAQGLAHFAVNRIFRDSRGFMWFCTREGLSMFDGYGFTTYRVADGLPSSHVTDILETPEGLYWIGTIEGLALFDPHAPPKTEAPLQNGTRARFTPIRLPGGSRAASISSLLRDRTGTIWIGTNAGLFRTEGGSSTSAPAAVDLGIPDRMFDRSIHALTLGRHGSLWIAAGNGFIVRRADGSLGMRTRAEGIPATRVGAMVEDRAGRIWAATINGLWLLALDADQRPRIVRNFRGVSSGDALTQILETRDGTLWVGTTEGLRRFSVTGEAAIENFVPVTTWEGVPIPPVSALAEDSSGHLWIGTATVGALRLPRGGFNTIAESADLKNAGPITETAAGEVAFIGIRSHERGDWAIFCSNGDTIRAVKPGGATGLPSWAWNQVFFQDSVGDWWLGTGAGVFRYSGARTCGELDGRQPVDHFDSQDGLASDTVIRLFEDSKKNVWIATVGHAVRPDGLSRWIRSTRTMQTFGDSDGLPTFERHYASAFAEDRAGNVWIGFSHDGGLARWRNGRFEVYTRDHGLPAGLVRDLVIDASGRLWIASYRAGLSRIDDPTVDVPRFRVYAAPDSLSSNETYAIVPDGSGRFYVASAAGIDRLDPEVGLDRRYTQAAGLPPGDFNAALRDRRGTLWFTQATGAVLRFAPPQDSSPTPLTVLITSLQVNGEPQRISAVGQSDVAPFRLSHDRNSLQVAFVALGSGIASDYRYRYALGSGTPKWSAFTDARTLNFANLAPGEYRLLVEARDANGRVAERPAAVEFTIVPPFWQRRWFAALVALSAVGAAYGFHRHRLRQVLAIARIRDRIATDLHDELGANLTRIAVLGEVGRQEGMQRESSLSSIAGIARESIANMRDIVWSINPTHDSMEDLVRKMRQHASETFAAGDTTLTFHVPRTLNGKPMDLQVRHDLFLLFKEAVNNAARHSRCTRVDIRLEVERHGLQLRVSDDGVGYNPDVTTEGHGRRSMQKRAMRMGGRIAVDSAPGRGTTITLTVPSNRVI